MRGTGLASEVTPSICIFLPKGTEMASTKNQHLAGLSSTKNLVSLGNQIWLRIPRALSRGPQRPQEIFNCWTQTDQFEARCWPWKMVLLQASPCHTMGSLCGALTQAERPAWGA